MGRAVDTLIVSLTRPPIFLLPLVLLLPRLWQLNGMWLSFPGGDLLTFLLTLALLIPLLKALKNPPETKLLSALNQVGLK